MQFEARVYGTSIIRTLLDAQILDTDYVYG
jgi:hypothetical protein